ncbi:DUF72 domain-containing protein [Solicola sp. PLA-1-18]|uniref:DUF72 domain-containing protein n=1 Tax=Solicola sp. PLA-1-18 TaxID=3380532 RepID=UPI003B80C489
MSATIRIGISGWTYAPWRGTFYPAGLVHRRELAYAAERLGSIEVNGSFYALQKPSSYARWRSEVLEHSVLALKGPRFVTHMKRLKDARVPVANFLASGPLALGPHLGPLLWQLPATLAFDESSVAEFLRMLPRTTGDAARLAAEHDDRIPDDQALTVAEDDRPLRHAVEPRHPSWAEPAVVELFRREGVALVMADTAGTWPEIREVTSDFVYLRLHGDDELYVSGYTDEALDVWAQRLLGWRDAGLDVYCYFDNDTKVRSPFDAMALMERCGVVAG